ncbi:MAG: phosphotransferase [Sphingobacteriales bacterium]|jgi:aminoglycoside/choline kinase family phosphotransferase|nr:phosphotransferase [Sphingobacteriales bacterium]MBP9142502.1 phosphotransferase [Chitinophagales bacterium]MDA0199417.1 phosphotransferase [Bacteroidota bacterium]MBK7526296.1 phosphotransferase [Sphingobacteriales bacterium]MBK8678009.1 phosphotransferase [Sphingobacteriales bacterium]
MTAFLSGLFKKWANMPPETIQALPPSASYRQYYRLSAKGSTAIAAINANQPENNAFLYLAQHFKNVGLPVPEIYASDPKNNTYLQEDLGDESLFEMINTSILKHPETDPFPQHLLSAYKASLEVLAKMQILSAKHLNFEKCYPKPNFDAQTILWDCQYFKYCFVKPLQINFDEAELEHDFEQLAQFLLNTNTSYFMHRDYQARNIMWYNQQPYVIDFQGGRRGALQYDVASLLFQARAQLPSPIRTELLNHYLQFAQTLTPINTTEFLQYYNAYVLIRLLQLLGAYGFRGLVERKQHFIDSIVYCVQNLAYWLNAMPIPINLPALTNVCRQIVEHTELKLPDKKLAQTAPLTVSVHSFSYKLGIPNYQYPNGGGFVFDCRSLLNPGRLAEYQYLSGLDKPVADFLRAQSNADAWLSHVIALTDTAVKNCLTNNFDQLTIAFGCTGGQHRSVYCAQKIADRLEQFFGVKVVLEHTAKAQWKKC